MRWVLLLIFGLIADSATAQERETWTCKSGDGDSWSVPVTMRLTIVGNVMAVRLTTENPSIERKWDSHVVKNDPFVLAAVEPSMRGFGYILVDRQTGRFETGMIETRVVSDRTKNGRCLKD